MRRFGEYGHLSAGPNKSARLDVANEWPFCARRLTTGRTRGDWPVGTCRRPGGEWNVEERKKNVRRYEEETSVELTAGILVTKPELHLNRRFNVVGFKLGEKLTLSVSKRGLYPWAFMPARQSCPPSGRVE